VTGYCRTAVCHNCNYKQSLSIFTIKILFASNKHGQAPVFLFDSFVACKSIFTLHKTSIQKERQPRRTCAGCMQRSCTSCQNFLQLFRNLKWLTLTSVFWLNI